MYRIQKNITLNEEQVEFVKANHRKINNSEIAKMLGLGYTKVHRNMLLMGLVTSRKPTAKVVSMEGYFNIDEEARKYYNY